MLIGGGVLILAVRIAFAWLYRCDVNPDGAIVHLMVQHMVSGDHPWPVFFYGQAYMGSFEPMVSALLAKLFGYSFFTVCCGTALFGAATVACAALWAGHVGGRRAGWIAVSLLVLGLQPYIHYFASPRGGYGALLFFTTATLAWGAHLLEREMRDAPRGFAAYFLLGLGAGLGFWSNFLTFPAVAAVGLAFLLWRGWRAVRRRILLPAAGGFVLGALPLWAWNLRHDWASLDMSGSVGFTVAGAAKSLALIAGPRLRELLGVNQGYSRPVAILVVVVHLLLLPGALALLAKVPSRSRTKDGDRSEASSPLLRMHVSVAALWLGVFLLCFAASPQYTNFHTPRYLLPAVPIAAWLAAIGATRAPWRSVRLATLACAALSLAWQLHMLPNSVRFHRKHMAALEAFTDVGETLVENGIRTAYASYLSYLVNPITKGEAVCSDPRMERYRPYARRLEFDPSPAVLDDFGGLSRWIHATGGSMKTLTASDRPIFHDLQPPPLPLVDVSLAEARMTDGNGNAFGDSLRDLHCRTHFLDTHSVHTPEDVFIAFPEPTAVSCVRLWGVALPPSFWEVAVREADSAEFRTLATQVGATDLFWSGPRVYWSGPQHRHECRFPETTAREFRIRFVTDPTRRHVHIPEIQLLREDAGVGEELAPPIEPLVDALRARGVERLYADRWIANRVFERTGGEIWTSRARDALLHMDRQTDPAADVTLAPGTAILSPLCGVPSLRKALAMRCVPFTEEALPPYGTLFHPEPRSDAKGLPVHTGIRFAGAYALLVQDAEWARARLEQLGETTRLEDARELAELAPDSLPVLRTYADLLARGGAPDEAAAVTARIDSLRNLQVQGPATFLKSATWMGCSAEPREVRPGGRTVLTHRWHGDLRRLSHSVVFVHLTGPDGYRFQDDHPFPFHAMMDAEPHTEASPFADIRTVHVPEDAPPGAYRLSIGLYPAAGGARLRPDTGLPTRRHAVVARDFLTILPSEPSPSTP
jgi:4-amino-4-deoxy-L-arabinose transferase-like glycosyltransferase